MSECLSDEACVVVTGSMMGLWPFGLFFFFQAEDGIRDGRVTGVQTCALPISIYFQAPEIDCSPGHAVSCRARSIGLPTHRSEERRVGKECRSRWSPDH